MLDRRLSLSRVREDLMDYSISKVVFYTSQSRSPDRIQKQ